MARPTHLTGMERTFGEDEVIVSKTDARGHIVYANPLFVSLSGYAERELIGAPHSILRHPHMPRAIFDLLWTTLRAGEELFAYIVNRSKNGDHYWVFAHVTPSFDARGEVVGYHSNRRAPDRAKLTEVKAIYARLLDAESRHTLPRDQIAASRPLLDDLVRRRAASYAEYIFAAAA